MQHCGVRMITMWRPAVDLISLPGKVMLLALSVGTLYKHLMDISDITEITTGTAGIEVTAQEQPQVTITAYKTFKNS